MPKKIISLGGSLVCPQSIDTDFLKEFRETLLEWLSQEEKRQAFLIVGGGGLARTYQEAYERINPHADKKMLDWIGIKATHLNAQLVGSIFQEKTNVEFINNYDDPINSSARILVAGGWKPGFSTDFCAVTIAEKMQAQDIINLSNIKQVYTADPAKEPTATPLERITWENFQKIVGKVWTPGANFPFDPIASERSKNLNLKVIVADGKNFSNLKKILNNEDFLGTTIAN